MSVHQVPLTSVLEVNPHPNAHSLDLLTIYGFQVVAKKDRYKVGDSVVFVPVDSVLPAWLEEILFPPGAHFSLTKGRIRQIRIRKFPSQGMVIDVSDLNGKLGRDWHRKTKLETDLAEKLEIKKYEPPFADHTPRGVQKRNKPLENPRFHQYKGCENIKWFPNLFKEGDEVIVQEKLHGSNCRASIQPTVANTIWKKVKKFFGLLPEFENCYGSNMIQLQERQGYGGYYGSDVYGAVLQKVDAFAKMKPGESIFGELIGEGIQKGYTYGHKEHHFVLFDVKVTKEDGSQEYLDPAQVEQYAKERGFDMVPVLFRGPFNKANIERIVEGHSVYCPKERVREGIVIKAATLYGENGGKKALKWINPTYLDGDQSDTH